MKYFLTSKYLENVDVLEGFNGKLEVFLTKAVSNGVCITTVTWLGGGAKGDFLSGCKFARR